jgi:hypothetical protein
MENLKNSLSQGSSEKIDQIAQERRHYVEKIDKKFETEFENQTPDGESHEDFSSYNVYQNYIKLTDLKTLEVVQAELKKLEERQAIIPREIAQNQRQADSFARCSDVDTAKGFKENVIELEGEQKNNETCIQQIKAWLQANANE